MGPTYYDTFIEVAEDCSTPKAEVPIAKGDKRTKAVVEYELIAGHPYTHTGEDIAFLAHALYNDIPKARWAEERAKFFEKGQPCLRASALGKRYGWGTHHDTEGKVALVALESKDYRRLAADPGLKHTRAMRTKRAG